MCCVKGDVPFGTIKVQLFFVTLPYRWPKNNGIRTKLVIKYPKGTLWRLPPFSLFMNSYNTYWKLMNVFLRFSKENHEKNRKFANIRK